VNRLFERPAQGRCVLLVYQQAKAQGVQQEFKFSQGGT